MDFAELETHERDAWRSRHGYLRRPDRHRSQRRERRPRRARRVGPATQQADTVIADATNGPPTGSTSRRRLAGAGKGAAGTALGITCSRLSAKTDALAGRHARGQRQGHGRCRRKLSHPPRSSTWCPTSRGKASGGNRGVAAFCGGAPSWPRWCCGATRTGAISRTRPRRRSFNREPI